MKWGKAYGADYANILYSMVSRNTQRPLTLVCFTDDTNGLRREIETHPLPPIELPPSHEWTPWRKVSLWRRNLSGLSGNVLFLDLDVVVTGSIDPFFDYRPEATFCVVENWTRPGQGIGNTSVFRLKVGSHPEVFDGMAADPIAVIRNYPNEQTFASRMVPPVFWPAGWCRSFKHEILPRWPQNFVRSAALPSTAHIVCFMGHPKPDEARDGVWPAPWHERAYKHVRPTKWVAEHWR
jgi:hypothetical protein